jgi:hypothetical protein
MGLKGVQGFAGVLRGFNPGAAWVAFWRGDAEASLTAGNMCSKLSAEDILDN